MYLLALHASKPWKRDWESVGIRQLGNYNTCPLSATWQPSSPFFSHYTHLRLPYIQLNHYVHSIDALQAPRYQGQVNISDKEPVMLYLQKGSFETEGAPVSAVGSKLCQLRLLMFASIHSRNCATGAKCMEQLFTLIALAIRLSPAQKHSWVGIVSDSPVTGTFKQRTTSTNSVATSERAADNAKPYLGVFELNVFSLHLFASRRLDG